MALSRVVLPKNVGYSECRDARRALILSVKAPIGAMHKRKMSPKGTELDAECYKEFLIRRNGSAMLPTTLQVGFVPVENLYDLVITFSGGGKN